MATVQIRLNSQVFKDGTRAVVLRVTAGKVQREIQLARILPKFWNAEKDRVRVTHRDHHEINTLITEQLHRTQKRIDELRAAGERSPSIEQILQKHTATAPLSFTEHVRTYIEKRHAQGQIHTAEKYSGNLKVLTQFVDDKPILFADVTDAWLSKFLSWERNRGTRPNTLHRRIGFLKSVWHDAQRRGLVQHDPFAFIEVKQERVRKERLTPAELTALETLDLPEGKRIADARDCFLMQYYLRGCRVSDALMLTLENISVEGRINYIDGKTGKLHSVQIHDRLRALLTRLIERPRGS